MADEVTDTWLVGVVAHDDALSSVRVHAGYLAYGPTSGRDHRVMLRLQFGDRAAPAFPDGDQSAALITCEESIVAHFAPSAVLVAVLTVPGSRNLIFHAARPDVCASALDTLIGEGLDVNATDVVADPAWSMYRGLFTDAIPADADRRRIHEAASATGQSTPQCRVRHRFKFPTLADADQAAAALRDADLTVTFVQADDMGAEAPPSFVIEDVEALTQVDMARSRDALGGFALSWGGDYLGWEIVDL